MRPSSAHHHHDHGKIRPRQKKGGEAPKGACQPLPRLCRRVCELALLICRAAARHSRRRARLPALSPRLLSETVTSPTQLQAMLPGTWTAHDANVMRGSKKPAGVTRPILSQSSDSTSRLGRSTEGPDAQSRPGAGCKPARRHRTRSASENALAKASLGERVAVKKSWQRSLR
jgi:hypothetical protein